MNEETKQDFIGIGTIQKLTRLLAAPVIEPSQRAARIQAVETDIVLPLRILLVVILGTPTGAESALTSFHHLWWYCAGTAALAGLLCTLLASRRPAGAGLDASRSDPTGAPRGAVAVAAGEAA